MAAAQPQFSHLCSGSPQPASNLATSSRTYCCFLWGLRTLHGLLDQSEIKTSKQGNKQTNGKQTTVKRTVCVWQRRASPEDRFRGYTDKQITSLGAS